MRLALFYTMKLTRLVALGTGIILNLNSIAYAQQGFLDHDERSGKHLENGYQTEEVTYSRFSDHTQFNITQTINAGRQTIRKQINATDIDQDGELDLISIVEESTQSTFNTTEIIRGRNYLDHLKQKHGEKAVYHKENIFPEEIALLDYDPQRNKFHSIIISNENYERTFDLMDLLFSEIDYNEDETKEEWEHNTPQLLKKYEKEIEEILSITEKKH